jgi:PAS domain S-box-containing protein
MPTHDLALAFQALFERLPHAIVLVDPQRQIAAVNPAFTCMFGYSADEVVGRSPAFLYATQADAAGVGQSSFQQALNQRAALFEARYCRKDGTVFWAESAGVGVVDGDGKAAGVVGLHVDVTARHAAEERLQRANANMAQVVEQRTAELAAANAELARRANLADAANQAKSTFLATMSHEIRTPMNAIIGLTHLLSQELQDPLHRDRLAKIDAAAKHLLRIINDILDLSKIEAGKMTLREADFALEDVMSRAMQMVSAAAQDKGLELILDADHLPQHARGDATRLSQALINLLANAVKFTDHGWVRLKGAVCSDDGHRVELRFEVQDTGPGIDATRLAQLFVPFEQADTAATRRQGGTGLGLALTRRLARLMGGEAGARSVPGQGSVFWIQVMLTHPERASERAAPLSLAGRRVMIVDDVPEALAAEAERLSQFGMEVTTATSGEMALERIREECAAGRTFDVVLVDWKMPALDGIQTLAAMRRLMGAGMPPTMLFTAYADPGLRALAAEVGCLEVLDKPITASAMLEALMRLLRSSSTVPPEWLPDDSDSLRRRLSVHHAGQRILLVEDNPVNREVATEILRRANLIVESAEDGERAVTLAAARQYDLILMDVQMPGVSGLEATRRVRRTMGPALPVVAMTANAFDDDRDDCIAAGMNDHVAKPVDPDRLYQVLLKWLPLRTGAPPAGDSGAWEATLAQLEAIEAIDCRAALRRMGDNLHAMERVWRCFAEHYREGDPALQAAIAAQDRQALQVATHALAGACANIGATGLESQARSIQNALRDGVETGSLFEQALALHDALGGLAQQLGRALNLSGRQVP